MYFPPSLPFLQGVRKLVPLLSIPDLPSKWKSFPETDLFQYDTVTNKSGHTTTT
jgi:hypothetical protein